LFQGVHQIQNLIAQHVGRLKNLRIPEPKNMPPLVLQTARTMLVAAPMSRKVMLTAIQLDNQAYLGTGEVGHIAADRMLASKLQPIRSSPKHGPELAFGICHVPAQTPCCRYGFLRRHMRILSGNSFSQNDALLASRQYPHCRKALATPGPAWCFAR
tara:strand:- start:123 stop:593 length:471 start_codon:yes stop_codon:yes gene_type:complete